MATLAPSRRHLRLEDLGGKSKGGGALVNHQSTPLRIPKEVVDGRRLSEGVNVCAPENWKIAETLHFTSHAIHQKHTRATTRKYHA